MSLIANVTSARPRRQIILIVAIGAVISAVLIAGYFLVFRSPYAVLFTNLRPTDAATIVAELDKKKVVYRLKDGGTTILAPADAVDAARLNILSADLPLKGAVGFELFNKSDIGLTEFAQKINYQRALQGELARTIMTMDAVDTARVHLSLPDPTIFRDDHRPPKASVTVAPRAGKAIDANTVWGIRSLIASAVPDLEIANVVVLDEHGAVVSGPAPAETVQAASASPETLEQSAVEHYYQGRIQQALAAVGPAADFSVDLSASSASQADLAEWNPKARTFPLTVHISTARSLSAERAAQVRNLVTEALGGADVPDDKVTIGQAAQAFNLGPVSAGFLPAPPQAASSVDHAGAAVPAGLVASKSAIGWVLAGLLVVLLAGAILQTARRRPKSLAVTADQRDDYVRRLKILLDREEVHAASR